MEKKGLRLGHKIVKIWKWLSATSKKSGGYIHWHPHKSHRRSLANRLRFGNNLGPRRFTNFSHSRSVGNIVSPRESPVSLLHSSGPNHPSGHSSGPNHPNHFRLPHLQMHSLHFPHLHFHFHLGFHLHGHHGYKKGLQIYQSSDSKDVHVPKGFLAVYVGQGDEHQRYVIPVLYFNHPLFGKLLKDAEEEYGFHQKGTITIPCQVADFEYVQKLIDTERSHKHSHINCL